VSIDIVLIRLFIETIFALAEKPLVKHLAPFTDKDFQIFSLGDRIKDLNCFAFLYPDIPKDNAFSKFWTSSQGTSPSIDL
jgi:signal transducer and activator of transcription 5B